MNKLLSDSLSSKEGIWKKEKWRVGYYFSPHVEEGEIATLGGDRFGLFFQENDLYFFCADASGHGSFGARFWDKWRSKFDRLWEEFVVDGDIYLFSSQFNDLLYQAREGDNLCLTVGKWTGEDLFFANFGYGNYVFPQGKCFEPSLQSFGMKLGFVGSHSWSKMPSAYICHQIENAQRVIITTDFPFPGDYANPKKTKEDAESLHQKTSQLTEEEIIPHILANYPLEFDDVSVLVLGK